MDGYTVGEVARLARVSVRTLHHYDGIGLLTPSARSAGGYRLYSETDLDRLRRVLFYRELEFGLDQIAEILADAATGTDDHLAVLSLETPPFAPGLPGLGVRFA